MSREDKFTDDAPRSERMSPNSPDHGWWGRENIDIPYKKVNRLLRASVGKSWDGVWSKICAEYRNGYVADVIRSYVGWAVEKNATIVDGQPYDSKGRRLWYNDFYVDKNGILQYINEKRKYSGWLYKVIGYIHKIENKLYFRYENIWYECEFAGLSFKGDRQEVHQIYPRYDGIDQYCHFFVRIGRGNTYACVGKRQVDSKMTKRLDGLSS